MAKFFRKIFSWIPHYRAAGSDWLRTIINFLIAGLVIAAALFLSSYIEKRIIARSKAAKEKLLLIRMVEERSLIYQNLFNDFKRLEPTLPAVYSVIPSAEQTILFSDLVESLAKDTGNKIIFQFSSGEPNPDREFSDIFHARFDATLEGTKDTFERFLRGFDRLRLLAVIETLRIDGREGGVEGPAKMSLGGFVFIKK